MTTRTYVIAEAGVNHNGSAEMAKRLVDAAAEAGADAVKFQTFSAEQLVSKNAPKAEYQVRATGGTETQFEMLRKLELSPAAHHDLIDHARSLNIAFLSTPFDHHSVDLLTKQFGLDTIKVASGEITNAPLLLAIARAAKRLILSTGMSTLAEVENALGVIAYGFSMEFADPGPRSFSDAYASDGARKALQARVTLLHCTTEYPAPFSDVNLRAMDTLSEAFGLEVGYSDHTAGIHASVAAVARGAVMIEKHLTLDRALPGPDHKASLEPAEFAAMVTAIRDVEAALGSRIKRPSESEWKNRSVARKSLVAASAIAKDELFGAESVLVQRPGTGMSPFEYWRLIGQRARRAYAKGEPLDE